MEGGKQGPVLRTTTYDTITPLLHSAVENSRCLIGVSAVQITSTVLIDSVNRPAYQWLNTALLSTPSTATALRPSSGIQGYRSMSPNTYTAPRAEILYRPSRRLFRACMTGSRICSTCRRRWSCSFRLAGRARAHCGGVYARQRAGGSSSQQEGQSAWVGNISIGSSVRAAIGVKNWLLGYIGSRNPTAAAGPNTPNPAPTTSGRISLSPTLVSATALMKLSTEMGIYRAIIPSSGVRQQKLPTGDKRVLL